jgi:hypothetical protein
MSRAPRAALVASALLAGVLSSGLWESGESRAAEPLDLTCSAQTPTVPLGGMVTVKAWARSPAGRALRYTWTATAGRIEGRGAEARWSLAELRPGTFAASVTAADGASVSAECLVRITVRRDAQPRGMSRETGRFFLVSGQPETAGYGLYSYLLLGAPPSEASRERYLKAIEAYLSLIPDVVSLEEYVPRGELNIFYAPVRGAPAPPVTAQWVVDNYDYARARSVLRVLPRSNRDGPYILAAFKPLGGTAAAAAGPYLFQDLSSVPPHLAASWVREFLNQAAQERFWEEKKGAQLAQRLRATVGIMGAGLPEVRKSLDTWIVWVR